MKESMFQNFIFYTVLLFASVGLLFTSYHSGVWLAGVLNNEDYQVVKQKLNSIEGRLDKVERDLSCLNSGGKVNEGVWFKGEDYWQNGDCIRP